MSIRLTALALISSTLLAATTPVHAFGSMELTLGMYRIQTEVASTDADRQRGLMFRKDMPESRGMLFVFPMRAQHCMWMKNTLLPLSVAFLDEEGRIINIEDMAPQTETNHCASQPARYALEMSRGWFKQRGFGVGTKLGGIERAPAPQ